MAVASAHLKKAPRMPEPTVSPVIVTPIPASASRTLRLARLTTVWTAIVGFLPDLIELLLNLLVADPRFAAAVADWFPRPLRYTAMAVLIGYAQKQRQLRNNTVAPIAGTAAEMSTPLANSTSPQIASPEPTGEARS